MYEFHPYYTNDGSVGLYSPDFDDIYHSASGALTEAYEKFIYPIDFDLLLKKKTIKVLDICYGIGYNSKSFLNFIFFENQIRKNFSEKSNSTKPHIESVYTNNIFIKFFKNIIITISKNLNCNAAIHTNNIIDDKFPEIYIKAIDSDKNLSFLSPFILTGKKNFKNNNFNFHYDKINKFLSEDNRTVCPKINNLVNFLILDKIIQNNPEIFENIDILSILDSKDLCKYFDSKMKGIFRANEQYVSKTLPQNHILAFLHNIYYRHITNCYKNRLKTYKTQHINFELKNDDARIIIIADENQYNIIFLDAFSPSKCPCLWSYDFFKLLYEHLEPDGVILTYSTSAIVRSAMIEAKLYVGYIYSVREKKVIGTIASKDKTNIKYPLSDYDLGLIKTKAGIFYRDKNLTASNEAILEKRNMEVKSSKRFSSSKYKKHYKQEDLCSMI